MPHLGWASPDHGRYRRSQPSGFYRFPIVAPRLRSPRGGGHTHNARCREAWASGKEGAMSACEDVHEMREASTASLVAVVAIMIASALAFTLLTAPFEKLLGPGGGAIPAAIHGLMAFLYLFVGTIGLYLGWRLLTGHIRA